MANKVNKSPTLAIPFGYPSVDALNGYLTNLVSSLVSELGSHALRLNNSIQADGTETPSAPIILKPYVKAALPDVAKFLNGYIIVSDDIGGLTPAFSDGTNWRRTSDRNIIS